ncbi:hypothetical protein KSE_08250 [Kitasatospora setae KM-6054]|uniref:Lipoprotein n=1 Tax=Kitasatospora setae (strain ATCC 33774 / DSM 43861 / JCM 3304 / KCC A-0304 / NBRC 14216 / KM-6054) TaxID=452652 RepID=E4N633_KITSK|nr:hypothetical protein KSE_08250 [Kitasatospora setae KM-6054]
MTWWLAAVVALGAAGCTADPPGPPPPAGPWALRALPALEDDPGQREYVGTGFAPVHGRTLGGADIAGTKLVIMVGDDTCTVTVDPRPGASSPAGPSGEVPGSFGYGAARPHSTDRGPTNPAYARPFPGDTLVGPYTVGAGNARPDFDYITVGCGEDGLAVKVEGVPADAGVRLAPGGLRSRREGTDLYLTVGRVRD